jgi:hypothetical protein
VNAPQQSRPSPRPRTLRPVPEPPATPDPPAAPEPPPEPPRRSWATDAWYYARLTALALGAILVVSFMASAIILSTWPRLGGDYIAPIFERQQQHELPKPDPDEQRRRWPYFPPGDQVGRTPREKALYQGKVEAPSASATPSATP